MTRGGAERAGILLLDGEASSFQKHGEPNLEPPSDRRLSVFFSTLGAAVSAAAVLGAAWSWGFERPPLITVRKSQ